MTCPCVSVEAVTREHEESRMEMILCLSVDTLWYTVLQLADTQACCHQWSQNFLFEALVFDS